MRTTPSRRRCQRNRKTNEHWSDDPKTSQVGFPALAACLHVENRMREQVAKRKIEMKICRVFTWCLGEWFISKCMRMHTNVCSAHVLRPRPRPSSHSNRSLSGRLLCICLQQNAFGEVRGNPNFRETTA